MNKVELLRAFLRQNIVPTGVIQVGAHEGQEVHEFQEMGIDLMALFEPQPDIYRTLSLVTSGMPNVLLSNLALSDKPGVMDMYCDRDNGGQSSSLLKPNKHLENCPYVHFDKVIQVNVATLDSITLDRSAFQMLVMDCQGNELNILKGGEETLKTIEIIYTEVSLVPMYGDETTTIIYLENFLSARGFVRTWLGPDLGGWTDAIYVKTY